MNLLKIPVMDTSMIFRQEVRHWRRIIFSSPTTFNGVVTGSDWYFPQENNLNCMLKCWGIKMGPGLMYSGRITPIYIFGISNGKWTEKGGVRQSPFHIMQAGHINYIYWGHSNVLPKFKWIWLWHTWDRPMFPHFFLLEKGTWYLVFEKGRYDVWYIYLNFNVFK